jgi:hypothetical protein
MSETRVRRGTAVVAAVDEQRHVPCAAPFSLLRIRARWWALLAWWRPFLRAGIRRHDRLQQSGLLQGWTVIGRLTPEPFRRVVSTYLPAMSPELFNARAVVKSDLPSS